MPLVDSKMEKSQFKEFNIFGEAAKEVRKKNWILIWTLKGGTQRMRESAFYTKRLGGDVLIDG